MKTPSNALDQRDAWQSVRMAPLLKSTRTIVERLGDVVLSVEKL
jgi:hypothetical protein